ncbi:MAG: OmpA family protein [Bacteroidetes bacterium]|jgi:outer membrane protein OmpA-like peptidoglycan-associated protein/Tfp pilus assembly protein PilF|nr:OmpA family protein [Bacteroidota bacterium]
MKNIITYILVLSASFSYAQINSYLRKADKAVASNKMDLAKDLYLKAYKLDNSNYEANLGVGFVMSEFMSKYEEALPYLERAYAKNLQDTFPDLVFSLAKCYQHKGDYQKARDLYSKLNVRITGDKNQDLITANDLKKRMEDCDFAYKYKDSVYDRNIYVANIGPKINTEMAEYVPVVNNRDELIFTSRRKDSEKEKRSDLDGKYFENMYISKLYNGKPQSISTYTLVDHLIKTNHKKKHVSIISSSNDGRTLFLYQNNKVHEVKADATTAISAKKLSKHVNMDYYQNHAYISKDGKTLYFTSEDERGHGGLDIYKTTKGENGEWGVPENLGTTINTPYDEDAPYLSDDGQTLYFASKGHPGFGEYDIYRSTLQNGNWSTPENLKQPINSSGHDIFYAQAENGESSYFASYRTGGYGDMDIYQITYLNKFNKTCREKVNELLTINSKLTDKTTGIVDFEVTMPEKLKPVSYQWTFNQTILPDNVSHISQKASNSALGDSIYVSIIATCDTCIEPVKLCSYTRYQKPTDEIVVSNTEEAGTNPYDDKLALPYLSKAKTSSLNLNLTPIHFELNKSNISEEAAAIWKKNIEILNQHPELSILIYGFADSRGSEAYNIPLSKQRAQKIREYLKANGLKANRIEQVVGKGESFILNKCVNDVECTDAEHQENRRVEFILFEKKK